MIATGSPQSTALSPTQILDSLSSSPTVAQMISASRKLEQVSGGLTPVGISILRNITLEPGLPAALRVSGAAAGLRVDVSLGDFDSVEPIVFDSKSAIYASDRDLVVLALDLQSIAPSLTLGFASLTPDGLKELAESAFDRVITVVRAFRERSSATILVHNFQQPVHPAYGILDAQMTHGQRHTIGMLNARLASALAAISGAYVLDLDRLISEMGYDQALDRRYWHIARSPYTFAFQQRLAREYVTFALAVKGRTKKCLVLDCDNTLWGGVVGEDGLAGIALGSTSPGSAFTELHSAVLNLYERGVLLALASKNNEADVMEVFARHPASVLKPEHFVAKRINWNDKASNIREIASELNIGLDSLVFVDDNPFECSLVREVLPEVTVVELPKEPSRYADLIQCLPYFEKLTLSVEDRRRTEMYQASASRDSLRSSSGSITDYLRSLRMKLTIARADRYSIPRIAQLTQKTNQFNLTTRRYTEPEIVKMSDDPSWHIYYADVVDRFDNAGIIAVALVHDEVSDSRIDAFLLSCRVIGRGIEHALMSYVAIDCENRGVETIVANYFPTAKNGLAEPFLRDFGFTPRTSSDKSELILSVSAGVKPAPDWFDVIELKSGETR